MPQVFLFGDSITWGAWDPEGGGWAARLRRQIDRYQVGRADFWCPVYNLGVSGDTAAGVNGRLKSEVSARKDANEEAVILVAIGINDSLYLLDKGRSSFSTEQYRANLERIVQTARGVTEKVAFLGLTPIDETLLNPLPWDAAKAYKFDLVELFNQELISFCKETKAPCLNIWLEWVSADYKQWLSDGLHPNHEGHERIYRAVSNLLAQPEWLGRFLSEELQRAAVFSGSVR